MESLRSPRLLVTLILLLILAPALGLSPRSHSVRQALAQARRAGEAGHPEFTVQPLVEAARRMPERGDLWLQAGQAALEAGDSAGAIPYLDAAARLEQPGSFALLGDAYQHAGDLQAAAAAWEQAVARQPTPEGFRRLWQAHQALGNYPSAVAALQQLVNLQPQDAGLRFQLGLLKATQDPESALGELTLAAEMDPGLVEPAGKLRRAVQAARQADDRAYSLLVAGRILASLDHWSLAVEAFNQSTLLRPDVAEAWAYLGEAQQHLPRPRVTTAQPARAADGLAALQKALAIDPQSLTANAFLALYWQRQARYDLALEALETALQQDDNNPVLWSEIGRVQAGLGDLAAAVQSYKKAADLAPHDLTYRKLLITFSLENEYELREIALPAARRAVALAPKDPASLDLMAQVLIKLNDLNSAARFLHRSLEVDPEYAAAHLHTGFVLMIENEPSLARQSLERALELDPDGPAGRQAARLLQAYFP